jgi:transcriptional regulator with XRE-family HTH domain
MTDNDLHDVQADIDAALADPVRRARIEQYGRETDLILAIAALREALGLTQEDFASAANMSQENLSRIERSADVKYSTIERLARAGNAQLELTAILANGERVELLRPRTARVTRRSSRSAAPGQPTAT